MFLSLFLSLSTFLSLFGIEDLHAYDSKWGRMMCTPVPMYKWCLPTYTDLCVLRYWRLYVRTLVRTDACIHQLCPFKCWYQPTHKSVTVTIQSLGFHLCSHTVICMQLSDPSLFLPLTLSYSVCLLRFISLYLSCCLSVCLSVVLPSALSVSFCLFCFIYPYYY